MAIHHFLEKLSSIDPAMHDKYFAEAIDTENSVYLSKSNLGSPVVLFISPDKHRENLRISTSHIDVCSNSECVIRDEIGHRKVNALIVECKTDDESLISEFFCLVEQLVQRKLTIPAIMERLYRLIELFAKDKAFDKSVEVGMWGELLLVSISSNPGIAIDYWHSDKSNIFDFFFPGAVLEVKTTTLDQRHHTIGYKQAALPQNAEVGFIISILAKEISNGESVYDLYDQILRRVGSSSDHGLKLFELCIDTLGPGWATKGLSKFDSHLGVASLEAYSIEALPMFGASYHKSILNAVYKINFDSLEIQNDDFFDVANKELFEGLSWLESRN